MIIKIIDAIEKVIDFAWILSQDETTASYHRIETYEELKMKIEKGISRNDTNVIACYLEDELVGMSIYHWVDSEKYVQTTQFSIKDRFDEVASSMIKFIGAQLTGYELYIPMTASNEKALKYFEINDIECIEASVVTKLDEVLEVTREDFGIIEEITENNFHEYSKFHDKYAVPCGMFYNSENLLKKLSSFRIFAFKLENEIISSIFTYANEDISEVFGLFIDKRFEGRNIEKTLISHMLHAIFKELKNIDKFLYFVTEGDDYELDAVISNGFVIDDICKTYKIKL